ncbi:hypothetical protein XF_1618 [Xylella fastidiosa 9a5c]|uniref:Uncharacterized protein n=1 Tax=Xylella fastidiosa (strain 9a5c) TaxID=160492 RepID=Q9PCY6_XYLFA|nr:hypothetical protein XF_1618 [Xylella fastidiosa 9a5c]
MHHPRMARLSHTNHVIAPHWKRKTKHCNHQKMYGTHTTIQTSSNPIKYFLSVSIHDTSIPRHKTSSIIF